MKIRAMILSTVSFITPVLWLSIAAGASPTLIGAAKGRAVEAIQALQPLEIKELYQRVGEDTDAEQMYAKIKAGVLSGSPLLLPGSEFVFPIARLYFSRMTLNAHGDTYVVKDSFIAGETVTAVVGASQTSSDGQPAIIVKYAPRYPLPHGSKEEATSTYIELRPTSFQDVQGVNPAVAKMYSQRRWTDLFVGKVFHLKGQRLDFLTHTVLQLEPDEEI